MFYCKRFKLSFFLLFKIIFRFFLFLSILLSPYKPEMSMIRSCPDRLEFKNECYSTLNQSISKKTSIFALMLWEEQRLNRFWSEKRCETLLSLLAPQKVSSLLLFNTYLVMWKFNCEPLWYRPPSSQFLDIIYMIEYICNEMYSSSIINVISIKTKVHLAPSGIDDLIWSCLYCLSSNTY